MKDRYYDYARSFLRFTTDHSRHTPRQQLEASCLLTATDGSQTEFFLTCPCMSENMYRTAGLIQEPTALFCMIAGDNQQFLIQKRHASSSHDVREAHRVGERMSSHDGQGATVQKIDISVQPLKCIRKIETYREIREAILTNMLLSGRTTYRETDGTQVQLDYPIKICNIPHDHEGWQIDTGPVVMPYPASPKTNAIGNLQLAFILFNRRNYAEFALQRAVSVDGNGATTAHFSEIVLRDDVNNELFCVDHPL